MTPVSKESIRDFSGKIIGFLETDKDGNQQVRDFYGRLLGFYDKATNLTRDFYGRPKTRGNTVLGFLYDKQKK